MCQIMQQNHCFILYSKFRTFDNEKWGCLLILNSGYWTSRAAHQAHSPHAALRLRWSLFWRNACLWTTLLGASASNRKISAGLPSSANALRRLPRRRCTERISAGAGGRGNDFGEASSPSADTRPPTTDAASIGGFCGGQNSSMMHGGRVVIGLIDVYNGQNRKFWYF